MRKGSVTALMIAASLCGSAYAGNYYVGPSLFLQDISANESSFRGLHPHLAVGYAQSCGDAYLAGEIFAIPATLTLSDIRNPGATSTKASTSFGASFIPGRKLYLFNEFLGFARLGFITSKFSSPNVSKWGTQLGLGIQNNLTRNWVLRSEYIYTFYGSVSTIGTPNSNEAGVGLIYMFDG